MCALDTLAVYSQLADPAAIPPELSARIPAGWHLSQHQVATYRALRDPATRMVFNTAMTGDGKSVAAWLAHLIHYPKHPTIALYPTNDLTNDQYHSATAVWQQWGGEPRTISTLSGARLDALMDASELSRGDALRREFGNRTLLLTNPDILHAVLQLRYQRFGSATTETILSFSQNYHQLTFDEFHTLSPDQVSAILVGLILLYATNAAQPPKTLFLSATPDPHIMTLLQRAGFGNALTMIAPHQHGWYYHGTPPAATAHQWRPILQPSTLHFHNQPAEAWLATSGIEQVIKPWFQQHRPGARAAIIVNSVAAAHRIETMLRAALHPHRLTVARNTGLTGRTARSAALHADVLVATATVDVGVDFRINLLISEAPSAGTLLQRLGRLGRHTSYTDPHGHTHPFAAFAAHLLLPTYAYERLTVGHAGTPPALTSGTTITREALATAVQQCYNAAPTFARYIRRWGRYQALRVYRQLHDRTIAAQMAAVREELKPHYGTLLNISIVKVHNETKQREADDPQFALLRDEAEALRGSTAFPSAVVTDNGEVLDYSLLFLLANTHLAWLTFDDLLAHLRQHNQPHERYTRHTARFVACFRLIGIRDQRQPLTITVPPTTAATLHPGVAGVLTGVGVDCGGHTFINDLNRTLRKRSVVATIVPNQHPRDVQRQYYLPSTLSLFAYRHGDSDTPAGTIAFARDALLLDSRLFDQPLRGTGGAIIC